MSYMPTFHYRLFLYVHEAQFAEMGPADFKKSVFYHCIVLRQLRLLKLVVWWYYQSYL